MAYAAALLPDHNKEVITGYKFRYIYYIHTILMGLYVHTLSIFQHRVEFYKYTNLGCLHFVNLLINSVK